MEYNTIFGKLDWDSVRRGNFQRKAGTFMSIARIIYNGMSYNFGSQDGAVTIGDNFTLWRFIAPVDRFDLTEYTDNTLRETLESVASEVEAVPVPAWDEFFAFLGGNEEIANAALLGHDVIRIGGVKVNFKPIQNCNDFSSFMRWLTANLGEAGNLQSSDFITGQDMIIPLDMYNSVPVAITLKTPTQIPEYKGNVEIGGIVWTKFDDSVPAMLIVPAGDYFALYITETFVYPDLGDTIPQGWYDSNINPYDIEANPITVPITDWASLTDEQKNILKCFGDFIYDETQEVYNGTIRFMFRA